ncbi:MAG: relaxase domain-containing protein [Sphingopyxis sp.]|nr:relaxase domain-containing protein [Sphingopyxis sp.]
MTVVVSVSPVGSAAGAAEYYAQDNYYLADQSAEASEWGGEGAERLGLLGEVKADQFEAILAGKLPNGVTISGRGGGQHVAGIDLTFSAPKSVSLVALVGKDERVSAAHLEAVRTTMSWAEKNLALARQGANGRQTVRTDNLTYALFPHQVTRGLDPGIHVHAVIAGISQRPDSEWRALRNTALFKDNTLIGAVYHAELRASLEKLGYAISLTGKHGSFEIAGIDRATIEQWSTRRTEILHIAERLGISSPEGMQSIAERSREAKAEIKPAELDRYWQSLATERGLDLRPLIDAAREAVPQRNVFARVREWGHALLDRITHAFGPKPEPLLRNAEPASRGAELAAAFAVSAGVRHLTERQATFEPGQLLRASLNFAEHGARVAQIEPRIEALVAKGVLITKVIDGVEHMTTRDVLRTENELIARTLNGRNLVAPLIAQDIAAAGLADATQARGIALSTEQSEAALAVLSGPHRYQLIQGDAGSGKTTLFSLIHEVAQKHGTEIVALTPQHRLANDLRQSTSMEVETVAGFLARNQRAAGNGTPDAIDKAAHEIGNKILLIDEASMLSSRQMLGIMQIVDNAGAARLVLVGDAQQIAAPEAGRPFALLQEEGAPSVRLSENRRQLDPIVREAVAAAKTGNAARALDLLGNKVTETPNPAKSGADAWLALSQEERARTAIFTSGHALRTEVLDQVRAGLINEGKLGATAITLKVYENLNLTNEQMRQHANYSAGMRLEVFQRQTGAGVERGKYDVTGVDRKSGQVSLMRDGKQLEFKPSDLAIGRKGTSLSVPGEIEVRAGDRLMWTTNNRELGITNGGAVDILAIGKNGLTLRDDTATRTIAHDNPLRESLAHGLVLNMHRAQGLTVDRAITIMDSHDRQLNSASLFYVLSSRAREHLGLHVDSKQGLADAIGKHRGNVPHARDLLPGKETRSIEASSGSKPIGDHQHELVKEAPKLPNLSSIYPERSLGLEL